MSVFRPIIHTTQTEGTMARGKVLPARSRKGSRSRVQRPACRALARLSCSGSCLPLPEHAQVVGCLRPPVKRRSRRRHPGSLGFKGREQIRLPPHDIRNDRPWTASPAQECVCAPPCNHQDKRAHVARAPVFCRGARQSLFSPRRRSGKAGGHCATFSFARPHLRSRQSSRRKCASLRSLSSSGMPRREPHG